MPDSETSNVTEIPGLPRDPGYYEDHPEAGRPDERRRSLRRREDTGRWNTRERERLRSDIRDDITITTRMEINELRREREILMAERDRRMAEHERKRAEAEAMKAEIEAEIDKQRERREKLLNKLIAALTIAITGFGAYFAARTPPEKVAVEEAKAKVEKVEKKVEAAKTEEAARIDRIEATQKDLKSVVLDQQVQIAESTEFLADKIDARNPKSITLDATDEKGNPKYEAVRRANARAEKIKEARGESLLHDEIDALLGDTKP